MLCHADNAHVIRDSEIAARSKERKVMQDRGRLLFGYRRHPKRCKPFLLCSFGKRESFTTVEGEAVRTVFPQGFLASRVHGSRRSGNRQGDSTQCDSCPFSTVGKGRWKVSLAGLHIASTQRRLAQFNAIES